MIGSGPVHSLPVTATLPPHRMPPKAGQGRQKPANAARIADLMPGGLPVNAHCAPTWDLQICKTARPRQAETAQAQ
jgi:hypothetical protein